MDNTDYSLPTAESLTEWLMTIKPGDVVYLVENKWVGSKGVIESVSMAGPKPSARVEVKNPCSPDDEGRFVKIDLLNGCLLWSSTTYVIPPTHPWVSLIENATTVKTGIEFIAKLNPYKVDAYVFSIICDIMASSILNEKNKSCETNLSLASKWKKYSEGL